MRKYNYLMLLICFEVITPYIARTIPTEIHFSIKMHHNAVHTTGSTT